MVQAFPQGGQGLPDGAVQALFQLVQALLLLVQAGAGMDPLQARLELCEGLSGLAQPASAQLGQTLRLVLALPGEGGAVGAHQFGGGRGGGGAAVGNEVGDGEVGLVAHRGHHRQGGGGDVARQSLVVEGGQILLGAAAARQDEHVHLLARQGRGQGLAELGHRVLALHRAGVEDHLRHRVASSQDVQDVAQGGTRGRGDDPDAAGKGGQGALARAVEQALGLQQRLQAFEGSALRAGTRRFHVFDDELAVPARLVEGDAYPRQHLLAVARLEAQQVAAVAEQGAAHLGVAVLEAEVHVPRAGCAQVGDLALHPEQGEAALQHLAQLAVEAADGVDVTLRCGLVHRRRERKGRAGPGR